MGRAERTRGDYFERQTRDALRAVGWVVVRSAGSLGPADLVALRVMDNGGAHALLISCKVDGRCSPDERTALLAMAAQGGAEPLLAHRPKNGTVLLSTVQTRQVRSELKVPTRPRHRKEEVATDG